MLTPDAFQHASSKSPFWMAVVTWGACGNSVMTSMPTALQDLATTSSAVFQSVQPVGVIAFQGPSRVPSGSA